MSTPLQSRVPPEAAGQSLLAWLIARFRYHDAAGWRSQLDSGHVRHNDAVGRGGETLAAGDHVVFTPAADAGNAAATAPAVPVLFADDDLLVVDKPPHLVVQQEAAFVRHTFVGALAAQFPPTDGALRLEPVHRLDRETSGVLVLARSPLAVRALQRQFEAHAVQKDYVAAVRGVVADDALVLDGAIGPAAGSTIEVRRAVVAADEPGARTARTELRVLQRLRDATLVALVPRTGRTHQLRVHLEHLGHTIVDDAMYGQSDARYRAYVQHLKGDGDPRWPGEREVGRQLLHAASLACRQPARRAFARVHRAVAGRPGGVRARARRRRPGVTAAPRERLNAAAAPARSSCSPASSSARA